MTYFRKVLTSLDDSPTIDGFGRERVSEPYTIFSSSLEYSDSLDHWQSVVTGGGTAAFVPNQATVRMSTTTASGDSVIRQTYRYFRYLPGKSQLIMLTGVMGAAVANCQKRIGYFDASNGLFFQQDAAGVLSVVRRTNVTSTPVDTVVAQSSWNLDKLDGTGPSGYTLDVSKSQIFLIDFEWLGVGRVRMGFVIDGAIIYCHEFLNANNLTTVYMSTPNLPVRYEIVNTGVTASAVSMYQICSTVVSEGGTESALASRLRSVNNVNTPISVTTRRAILSIRPKATFNGLVNRGVIQPVDVECIDTGNQPVLIELVRGATLGGTPAWTSAATDSLIKYDTAGTTVTGGTVVWSGYLTAATAGMAALRLQLNQIINTDLALTLDINGANPIPLTIVATSFGNATTVAASMNCKEIW